MPVVNYEAVHAKKVMGGHPLAGRETRPYYNWHEWLSVWKEAKTFNHMRSLLHDGFTVTMHKHDRWDRNEPEYSEVDRLAFYFSVADGWTGEKSILLPGQQDYEHSCYDEQGKWVTLKESEYREKLANKAFEMLCAKIFSLAPRVDGEHHTVVNPRWWEWIVSEKLLPIVQNFWRLKESHSGRVEVLNLRRSFGERDSHNEKKAYEFLANLATFMWEWRGRPDHDLSWDKEKKAAEKESDAKIVARIDAAKPWMIEILNAIGRLDVLDKYVLVLEEPCIAKLKEIALRAEMPYRFSSLITSGRKAQSIEEACYAGSKSAWFIKRIENARAVEKRLKQTEEAKRKLEAAREYARRHGVEA